MKIEKTLLNEMIKVIGFYANPETYVAIGFMADPPCGDLIEDFSKTFFGSKPGKRAREILKKLNKCIKH